MVYLYLLTFVKKRKLFKRIKLLRKYLTKTKLVHKVGNVFSIICGTK